MKSSRPHSPSLLLVRLVCRALDAKKAEDLRVLDVSAQSSITNFLVLANGTSDPHLRALRIELEKVLDAAKVHIVGIDTEPSSGWMVVDAFDVMIHIFTPSMRTHYQLENLWKDAPELSTAGLLTEPKPRTAARKKTTPRTTRQKSRKKS